MGEQPLVKTVANVFREICYANRDQMTAGIICAGWDKREGGQVYTYNASILNKTEAMFTWDQFQMHPNGSGLKIGPDVLSVYTGAFWNQSGTDPRLDVLICRFNFGFVWIRDSV